MGTSISIKGASVNPTNNYIPYNNSGVFADSPLRRFLSGSISRVYNDYDFRISRQGPPSVLGLYSNANGGIGQVASNQGIQWGFENNGSNFQSGIDFSIVSLAAPTDFYGSTLLIKTQKQISFSPVVGDTQSTAMSIKPWDFMESKGGVTVHGGGASTSTNSYFNVMGDDGFPPMYKFSNSVAKFAGSSAGVVFPSVDNSSQSMMIAENGMVVYNSDTNKLQVYAGGTWVDLH
jgi:hypothetical protein